MKTFEFINADGDKATYNVEVIRCVSVETRSDYEGHSWVRIDCYPLSPLNLKLTTDAAEKLYLSVKAFLKSDSDEELIIQQTESGCVNVQTIRK